MSKGNLIMLIAEAKIHKLASNFMHFGIRFKYFLNALLHFGKSLTKLRQSKLIPNSANYFCSYLTST